MITLKVMQVAEVCKKYNNGTCMLPLSLVFMLRVRFDLIEASFDDLIPVYTSIEQESSTEDVVTCTNEYMECLTLRG